MSEKKAYRVVLADDHELFREGLANILNAQPDFVVIGEAGDGLEAFIMARELKPDLILMDVGMPGCDGVEAAQRIKAVDAHVVVVMLTVEDDDERLFEAIRGGAQGYLLKTIRSQQLVQVLRGAMHGEAALNPVLGGRVLDEFRRLSAHLGASPPQPQQEAVTLTLRERDVLCLIAEGATDREIAAALTISVHTVKTHVRNILAKLQLSRRHEAAAYARRENLIPRQVPYA